MSRVANRYSKALFEMAVEKNSLDTVENSIQNVKQLLEDSQEFFDAMRNPLLQADIKAGLIKKLFRDRLDQLTYHFLILVCRKKRASEIGEIINRFQERVNDYRGILIGEIISAVPVRKDQKDMIVKRINTLTGKEVRLGETVDPSVVGGFIVKVRDTVIDLSVSRQLDKLREKLVFG